MGATALHHLQHKGAGGQSVLGRILSGDILDHHAKIAALYKAIFQDIIDHSLHIVHGDREADTLNGSAGIAGAGILGSGDTDHLALHIEQRSTGVTGVDGCVSLDHTHRSTVGVHHTVHCADIAHGKGGGKLTQGVTDGRHHRANHQVIAAANAHTGEILTGDLQDSQVIGGIIARHLSIMLHAVSGDHRQGGGAFEHVVIGDNIAIFRNDKAAAGRSRTGNLAKHIGGHLVRDGNHRIHIHRIYLRGCQLPYHRRAVRLNSGGRRCLGNDPAAQLVHFLLLLRSLGIELLFPGAVQAGSCYAAAANYQNNGQHSAEDPFSRAAFFLLFLFLFGGLRERKSLKLCLTLHRRYVGLVIGRVGIHLSRGPGRGAGYAVKLISFKVFHRCLLGMHNLSL